MVIDMLDIVPVGVDGKIAALFRTSGFCRGETQRAEPLFPRKSVATAVTTVVTEGQSDRVVDRCSGVVFDRKSKERDRHRRVTVVVRDERAERRHAHPAWKVGLMELKLRHWKASDECDV